MLAEAVADRLLMISPFASLKGGNEANPARQRFIDRDMATKVLAACPDAGWRLIFSLARFDGLRSTRRTELQEIFQDHVINPWLGHFGAMAAKHYLQVTDEHWQQAANSRTPTGTPITTENNPSGENPETKKARNLRASDVPRLPLLEQKMTPTGIEPVLPP